jgi:hypothetical protein
LYFVRTREPDFHPEFGFMCPSSGFRRVVRVAVLSIAFGVTVGAIAVFALGPRADLVQNGAFHIIFADEAAAASAAETPATAAKAVSPTAGIEQIEVAARKPAQSDHPALEPAVGVSTSAAADPEEPKLSAKKQKKKVAQSRPRRRDAEVSDIREPNAAVRVDTGRDR